MDIKCDYFYSPPKLFVNVFSSAVKLFLTMFVTSLWLFVNIQFLSGDVRVGEVITFTAELNLCSPAPGAVERVGPFLSARSGPPGHAGVLPVHFLSSSAWNGCRCGADPRHLEVIYWNLMCTSVWQNLLQEEKAGGKRSGFNGPCVRITVRDFVIVFSCKDEDERRCVTTAPEHPTWFILLMSYVDMWRVHAKTSKSS